MPTSPSKALGAVEIFCEQMGAQAGDEMRLECSRRGATITITRHRAPDRPEVDSSWTSLRIAQLRFDLEAASWTLHWLDRHDRWHVYDDAPSSENVDPLLREIRADPSGIFWGKPSERARVVG